MKNYTGKQMLAWTVIVLVVIVLSAAVSYIVTRRNAAEQTCCPDSTVQMAIHSQLGLSADQTKEVDAVNAAYRTKAGPLADSIRELRSILLAELRGDQPEPVLLDSIVNQISVLQLQLQQENIRQYLGLKKICTPDQAERLSVFFHDLYQCPMKENRIHQRHRPGRGPHGEGQHGQGQRDQ